MGYSVVQQSILQGIQWAFWNLAPYPILVFEMMAICVLSPILYFFVGKERKLDHPFIIALLVIASSAILSLVAFLLPPDLTIVSWGHQGIILAVGLSLFVALFGHHVFAFLYKIKPKREFLNHNHEKPQATIVVSILLISAIYAPFIFVRVFLDPSTLKTTYDMFAVTSIQDNEVIFWIRENLTKDAVILVNPQDPGLFIPSISQRKTVFTATGSQLSRSYQKLCDDLYNETLNVVDYDIMKNFNLTYVYVGSAATHYWLKDYRWSPQLFLGNPNFELVKKVGNACLFKVLYKNPSLVFQDDFEHENWNAYEWSSGYDGNGEGNVTLAKDFGNDSQKYLKITAQTAYTISAQSYVQYVRRQFFVPSDSDVTLSFDYNATQGFHSTDAFAVLISDINRNHSLVLTTSNGAYANYANSIFLDKPEGHFELKDLNSLSALWLDRFHSTFPTSFYLEFVNYDRDGVKNIVYIDNIKVAA
jgi:hypothetical protein